jgi:hypothetical protein
MSIPKPLKFGSKIESAMAKSYKTNIQPQNGTGPYNLGDTITVNIPTRNNLLTVPPENIFKFNINATNTSAANPIRWDSCGAHGLIQRIRIFHGSNLIEDIDNYGLLAKAVFDLQVPTDSAYGKYTILAGTRNDMIAILPDVAAGTTYAAADFAVLNKAPVSCYTVNSGASLAPIGGQGATSNITSQTYCLSLISIMGTLCNANYFPLFACTSAPIRMEIQLVQNFYNCLACKTALTNVTVSNVEYIANFVELSDEAMGIVTGSLQGQPLQFAMQSYKNYSYTYNIPQTTSTEVSMPIPAKFSSLKSLLICIRDQQMGKLTFFPFSSVTCGIQEYYFRIGSNIVPTKAPNTSPEMFCEVLKAIGSVSDLNHQPSIDNISYQLATSVAVDLTGTTNSGSFYIGLDLENYPNAPKDTMFAGYNSSTDDISAVMKFASPNTTGTTRFDAYALYDQVVSFSNNTCFVQF